MRPARCKPAVITWKPPATNACRHKYVTTAGIHAYRPCFSRSGLSLIPAFVPVTPLSWWIAHPGLRYIDKPPTPLSHFFVLLLFSPTLSSVFSPPPARAKPTFRSWIVFFFFFADAEEHFISKSGRNWSNDYGRPLFRKVYFFLLFFHRAVKIWISIKRLSWIL